MKFNGGICYREEAQFRNSTNCFDERIYKSPLPERDSHVGGVCADCKSRNIFNAHGFRGLLRWFIHLIVKVYSIDTFFVFFYKIRVIIVIGPWNEKMWNDPIRMVDPWTKGSCQYFCVIGLVWLFHGSPNEILTVTMNRTACRYLLSIFLLKILCRKELLPGILDNCFFDAKLAGIIFFFCSIGQKKGFV